MPGRYGEDSHVPCPPASEASPGRCVERLDLGKCSMAEIIRLRGSPHEQAQQLLPWYVNGTLEADEAAEVETHLAECAECRADLAAEQVLSRNVAALPLDVEHACSMLSDRIDAAGP